MAIHQTCDGMRRRDFIRVGAIGTTGLTLANYLRFAAAGQTNASSKAKSAIFINLRGGPTHLDTFDLKPDAPKEYRGLFNPISTNADGVEICEHLPRLATCADKYVIMRGVTHSLGAHALGQAYITTGNRPLPSLEFPSLGSVAARELVSPKEIPPFVAIPNTNEKPGYLGVKYAPFNTGSSPQAGAPFHVRGITLGNGLTVSEVEKRNNLLKDLDTTFRNVEQHNQLLEGLDQFSEQAHAMITSRKSREAFDISKESPDFAKPYGTTSFGASCLLATRLIEAGVRFVSLSVGGWDTHRDNFDRLENRLLPPLDEGLSALLNGLEARGLLDTTTIFMSGEFGRTPKINERSDPGGRDHYPRCMFMFLAGGGIKGGRVLGKSDDKATFPDGEGYTPDDVIASFYHTLGIDHTKEYHTTTGRPVMIVRNGNLIPELLS